MNLRNPPYQLIYLEWDDAVENSNWFEHDGAEKWLSESQWIVAETGFVLAEDKKAIYLAARWKPEDTNTVQQFGGLRRIPKNWIKKRVNLTKHL